MEAPMTPCLSCAKELAQVREDYIIKTHNLETELSEKDDRIKKLEQALDMAHSVGTQYRQAIEEALNMSTRGKLSPHDAKILIIEMIKLSQKKRDGK